MTAAPTVAPAPESRPTAIDEPSTWWVPAPPFRAHLRHLSDSTGVSWRVVAHVAGIPPRVAEQLWTAQPRRPGRIRRVDAERLYHLDAGRLSRRLAEPCSAADARAAARQLLGEGWTLEQLARATRQDAKLLGLIAAGGVARCPLGTTLHLWALLHRERTRRDRARLRLVA